MDRKELLKSPEYWTASIQMELYRQIEAFMKENNFNKTQLAEYLGCSKDISPSYCQEILTIN